jgi:hypothetical protein
MVTQDGDHRFDGGEKQAGLRPQPRPQLQGSSPSLLGGGRGELEFYLPHGPAGQDCLVLAPAQCLRTEVGACPFART